jgi:hypothetical protein
MKQSLARVLVCLLVLLGAYIVAFGILWRLPTLDDFFDAGVFGSVFKLFFSWLAVMAVYKVFWILGRSEGSGGPRVTAYVLVIGVALFLTWGVTRGVGGNSTNCDPLRGGDCEISEDPEPSRPLTSDEKLREAMLIFFGVAVPGLFGIRKGCIEADKISAHLKESVQVETEG